MRVAQAIPARSEQIQQGRASPRPSLSPMLMNDDYLECAEQSI